MFHLDRVAVFIFVRFYTVYPAKLPFPHQRGWNVDFVVLDMYVLGVVLIFDEMVFWHSAGAPCVARVGFSNNSSCSCIGWTLGQRRSAPAQRSADAFWRWNTCCSREEENRGTCEVWVTEHPEHGENRLSPCQRKLKTRYSQILTGGTFGLKGCICCW